MFSPRFCYTLCMHMSCCRLKFEEADFGSGSDTTLLEPPKEFQAGEKDLGAVYLVPHFLVVVIHPIAMVSALSHLLLKTKIKQSWSICCVSFSQFLSLPPSVSLHFLFLPFIHTHYVSHNYAHVQRITRSYIFLFIVP